MRYMMRYMYLKCILRGTNLRCRIHAGYMPNTCGIHITSEVIKIHAGYMRDTFGIHAGYMRDTYLGGLGECIDAIMEPKLQIQMYSILMYLDVSCNGILMYMNGTRNGTHQDTIRIHAGYITIHQDTYPIGPPPQNDRKPHVTRRWVRGSVSLIMRRPARFYFRSVFLRHTSYPS